MGPTGQAELVASQRSLQQCTARCIAPPAVARSGIRCSPAQSVAAQRNPLQRSPSCCIPAQSRLAAAATSTPSAAAAASAPLTAATGRNPSWSPSEHLRPRTECLVCWVFTPAALQSRSALLSFFRSLSRSHISAVCAQRSLVRLAPRSLHVHLGLRSSLATAAESTPRPHLHRD